MTRTGAQYTDSLRDGRTIYLDGALVQDPGTHPAYRNAVRSVARLYDFQEAPENRELMTFPSPDTGQTVGRCWQLPTSYQELVQRRNSLVAWAEGSYGFFGRSPDHVASCLCGMMMGIDVFRDHGEERARALQDYFAYVRENDLYVTYVIVNPQANRSKPASEQEDEYLVAGICDEDSQGITIKGAKMLGTGSVMANEVLVTTMAPLREGEEKYAFTAAVPLGAKGVKILSRKSYESTAVSEFDNPLSSQFDENDAVIYFDEVKVPWERVFVYRDVPMCQAQWHTAPTHVFQNYQAQVRFMVKLRFFLGLARRIAETNGIISIPPVVTTLGQLAAETSMMEGLVKGMEASGRQYGPYFVPDTRLLYSAQVLSQQIYPKIVHTIRDLAGGGMIMTPSSIADFLNPEIAPYIERTQKSPVADSIERVKLFKLAWDAVGSEFGSRHEQYEMFYGGNSISTRGHAYRTYDWDNVAGMVDRLMSSYDLPQS
jgi:4-hydroxyphenylacetate 3-monooxygenase